MRVHVCKYTQARILLTMNSIVEEVLWNKELTAREPLCGTEYGVYLYF